MIQFIFLDKHLDGAGRSLRHLLDKVKQRYFYSTSNKVIWSKAISNSLHGSKGAILAIFQKGPGWLCPQESLTGFKKNIFVLGFYEFLVMLEGKIRETPFF